MKAPELLRKLPSDVNSLLLTQAGRYWLEARLCDVRISEPTDIGHRNFFDWHARSSRAWHYFGDGSGVMDGDVVADVGEALTSESYFGRPWSKVPKNEKEFLAAVMGGEAGAVHFVLSRGGVVTPAELQAAMEADDPDLRN